MNELQNLTFGSAVNGATVSASAVNTGTNLDTAGAGRVLWVVNTALAGGANATVELQESDTTTDGDFTTVKSSTTASVQTVFDDSRTVRKRYLRVKVTANATHSLVLTSIPILADQRIVPSQASQRVGANSVYQLVS